MGTAFEPQRHSAAPLQPKNRNPFSPQISRINPDKGSANRGGGDASRATSFEGFSITSIESIEITRTRSADSDGLAPHRVSSRVGYAYRRFNGSVGMVWTDVRPDGNYGRYRPEQTQFDLSATWKLTNRYSLYVQARNFTHQPVKWMESPPGVVEGQQAALRQFEEYGANWGFGCRGTF